MWVQISVGLSWPIEVPDRKVFITQAFQVNYNLPWTINQTVRPPFLPYGRAFDAITGIDSSLLRLMLLPTQSLSDNSSPSNASTSFTQSLEKGDEPVRMGRRQPRNVQSVTQPEQLSIEEVGEHHNVELLHVDKIDNDENRHQVDMSAGELYGTLEKSLEE